MSEEIAAADASLIEIARLRTELERAEIARMAWAEIGAKAQADAAACYRILEVLTRVGDAESARNVALAALTKLHPGEDLFAELKLLRELAAEVDRWRSTSDARDLRYVLDTMDKIEQMKEGGG